MALLLAHDDPRLLEEIQRQEETRDELRLDERPSWTRLHWLALSSRDRSLAMQAACQRGGDVNAQSDEGDTPLHMAAWNCRLEHVDQLLALGANVHLANHKGNTALHQALRKGSAEGALLLLRAGADLAASDRTGRNGLSYLLERLALAWGRVVPSPSTAGGQVWVFARQAPWEAWRAPCAAGVSTTVWESMPALLRSDLAAWRLDRALPATQEPSRRAASRL